MTIFGWDMSHYDAPGIGNAVTSGIAFITHKAGGDALDQELGEWWSGVRGLGPEVLLGAYWVLYPDAPVSRADAFLAWIDSQCPGWRARDAFILQVDCEKWNGDPGTVPDLRDISSFCDRLKSKTGLTPIVYAPKWVYGNTLKGLEYPLWASAYVTGSGGFKALYPGDTSHRWDPYSGQVPAVLQYSSSAVIGGQTTCDANAYRGTLSEFKALLGRPAQEEDDMSAADAQQGFADAFGAMAATVGVPPTDDNRWGRQVRDNVNKVIDFATQPMADALTALTALVVAESPATASDIAAALAPLLNAQIGDGASPAEVEEIIRRIFGGLDA